MDTTTFTYTNPREFDGTPYEAAFSSGEQFARLLKLAKSAGADTFVLARVADLQRQQDSGREPSALQFEDGPVGKRLRDVERTLGQLSRAAEALAQAVGYDPLHPPKEE